MATDFDDIVLAVKSTSNAPPATITVAEAALQTFKKGWLVAIDGGYATNAYTNHGTPPTAIFGVAEEDAHNDTTAGTHSISIALAAFPNLFAANVKGSALANYVGSQSDIGGLFGVQIDTPNNRIFLDASVRGGANVRAFVYEIAQGTTIGDTNPRYVFSWLQNSVQFAGTS